MSGRGRVVPVVLVGLVVLMPAGAETASRLPPAAVPEQRHEVRPGDTLTGIAKQYGVTVAALVAANRLPGQDALLRVGQRLVIPPRGAAPPLASRPPQAPQDARRLVVLRAPGNLILAVPDFGDLLPQFSWPLEGHISSPFGRRRSGWHRGIDIKAGRGVPIVAAAGGVVVVSGVERRYGRVVKIEHPFGFMTVYAHNDQNNVEVGDRVWAGQTVGLVGRTGRATAHHLHFEIRHGGLVYNPLYMLPLPPRVVVDESLDEEPDEPDE